MFGGKILTLTFFTATFYTVCNGYYLYDLYEVMSLDVAKLKDVTMVQGPPSRNKAIHFSENTEEISKKGIAYAYLVHAISTSADFTFTAQVKITADPTDAHEWTIFALQNADKSKLYFSIAFKYSHEVINKVEDQDRTKKGKLYQEILIRNYVTEQRSPVTTAIKFEQVFEKDKWYHIQVRIRKRNELEVRLNCAVVNTTKEIKPPIEKFNYNGIIAFSQKLEKSIGGKPVVHDRFIGAIWQPQVINGEKAFRFYSPCDADFSVEKIPSEPLAKEYSDKKFKEFVEMSSSNIAPAIIYCQTSDGETHYNGDAWTTGACYRKECKDGKITETYICQTCTDLVTNRVYYHSQNWTNSKDPCLQHECDQGGIYDLPDRITCKKDLKCNSYGKFKLPNECCEKCYSDTCVKDHVYYTGCKRKCTDGANFICKTKTNGCWCKKGEALNDDGECVSLGECSCKVGEKTYLPGQSVRRSSCGTCVCSRGSMICFVSCFY